jgi:hypothetical protein
MNFNGMIKHSTKTCFHLILQFRLKELEITQSVNDVNLFGICVTLK